MSPLPDRSVIDRSAPASPLGTPSLHRTDPNFRMWDVNVGGVRIGSVHAVIPSGYEAFDRERTIICRTNMRGIAVDAVVRAEFGTPPAAPTPTELE